jgi:hypothetical protein
MARTDALRYFDGMTPKGMTVDEDTQTLTTIEFEHHELHEGDMYRAGEQVALANNGTRIIHIKTPNTTVEPHLQYNISNTLELEFQFYEGPTVSRNGTAVTSYNRNRRSTNTATLSIFHTPTTSGNGTELASRREGTGKTAGGSARSVAEWILAKNQSYLLAFTSRAGAGTTNYLNWWVVWYEHEAA